MIAPAVPPRHFLPVNVDTSLMCKVNKKQNPFIRKQVATSYTVIKYTALYKYTSYIDIKYTDYIKVFTNSSKIPDGGVSAAFCIPELNVEISKKITNNISIYIQEKL